MALHDQFAATVLFYQESIECAIQDRVTQFVQTQGDQFPFLLLHHAAHFRVGHQAAGFIDDHGPAAAADLKRPQKGTQTG